MLSLVRKEVFFFFFQGALLDVASDELVLQQLFGGGTKSGVLIEAVLHKVLERTAVLASQLGWAVLRH